MSELDFKGKEFVRNHHLSVPHRPLAPDDGKSVGKTRLDGNLIIHGDNLHALKALLPIYTGKVNCIYIDPPYNTGNEGWCYNDNVNSPQMQNWLNQNPVGIDDGLRHDKWCAMMYPRLVLLRELLAEDGTIFISIDDNEQHRLRMMMDEIFGSDNFRNLIQVRRGVKSVQRQFETIDKLASGTESIVFYTKNSATRFSHLTSLKESNSIGSWNNHWRGTDRPSMRYELFGKIPTWGQWRWGKSRSFEAIENYQRMLDEIGEDKAQGDQQAIDDWYFDNEYEVQQAGLLRPSKKGGAQHYVPPSEVSYLSSLWNDTIASNSKELKKILEDIEFTNPKSERLIRRIVQFVCGHLGNAIILDSFAGSGTTAHATLALNEKDGGNRKFILVECEDYANHITAERVRRVIHGIPRIKDKTLSNGLGGEFTYCTLGKPIDMDKLLTGESLPSFEALGTLLFHTATNEVIDTAKINENIGYLGSTEDKHLWLIYKPDLNFLTSSEAALTLDKAKEIAQSKHGQKRHLVFAPATFVSHKTLNGGNRSEAIPVDYQPLPWSLYRVAGS